MLGFTIVFTQLGIPIYFALSDTEELMYRQNLLALKVEQGIFDDEFYHYDTLHFLSANLCRVFLKEKKWMPSQEEFYIYSHSSVVR